MTFAGVAPWRSAVIADEELSRVAVWSGVALAEFVNSKSGEAWPSVPNLAKAARLSDRSVQRGLAELVTFRYLLANPRGNKTTLYVATHPELVSPQPELESPQGDTESPQGELESPQGDTESPQGDRGSGELDYEPANERAYEPGQQPGDQHAIDEAAHIVLKRQHVVEEAHRRHDIANKEAYVAGALKKIRAKCATAYDELGLVLDDITAEDIANEVAPRTLTANVYGPTENLDHPVDCECRGSRWLEPVEGDGVTPCPHTPAGVNRQREDDPLAALADDWIGAGA